MTIRARRSARFSERPAQGVENLLKLPAKLYGAVTSARNHFYDRKLLPSLAVSAPVISVGNITAGGTGKTPVVAMLVGGFLERGWQPGIVSRGYGGSEKGPAKVPVDADASRFGDEPTWFASKFPSVPVVVSGDRVAAAKSLLSEQHVDLLIADDGFQHRRLSRTFDIVVLDATEPTWHYRPLPLGRMREGFESLSRAHAIIITKANLAAPEQLSWLRQQVGIENAGKIHVLESRIDTFVNLQSGVARPASDLKGMKLLLLSGIGRPANFENNMRETGADIANHIVYPDHHSYTARDLAEIERAAADVDAIVTTEKDAVKLRSWRPEAGVWVSQLETKPRGDLKELYEAIGRTFL